MASDGNMIDGVREPTILIRNGLSIVSLYQYRNNLPEKFLKGLEDTGSAKAEVAADAKAALEQARLVGQPEGSAIYFGVDFNVNRAAVDSVLEYFRAVGRTVGNHYAIGVYGNGFVNRILRQEKLVAYNWISASRAHAETVDFYNSGQWHLFQNQVDRRWFGPPGKCSTGLDVDTNMQNPNVSSIGAWGAGEVDRSRNQKIFDSAPLRDPPDAGRSAKRRRRRRVDRPSRLQIRQERAAKCQCQNSRAIRRLVRRGHRRRRQRRRPGKDRRSDAQSRDDASLGIIVIRRACRSRRLPRLARRHCAPDRSIHVAE